MIKYYFISYAYPGGFGNVISEIKNGIFNLIELTEKLNIDNPNIGKIIILYYKELSEQEYKEFI